MYGALAMASGPAHAAASPYGGGYHGGYAGHPGHPAGGAGVYGGGYAAAGAGAAAGVYGGGYAGQHPHAAPVHVAPAPTAHAAHAATGYGIPGYGVGAVGGPVGGTAVIGYVGQAQAAQVAYGGGYGASQGGYGRPPTVPNSTPTGYGPPPGVAASPAALPVPGMQAPGMHKGAQFV